MKNQNEFGSRRFVKVKVGGSLFRMCEDYDQQSLLEFIKNEIDDPQIKYDSRSKHAKNRKVEVTIDRQKRSFFVKRFFTPRFGHLIKESLRSSKAINAWKAGLMLSANGFHTAPVVLAGERRRWGLLVDSVFVAEAMHALTIGDYLSKHFGANRPADAFRGKRTLIRALGREVGRMHAVGIVHGDLLPGNILVDSDGEETRFVYIDNDRTRKLLVRVPMKLIVRNLVQLGRFSLSGITLTDRLRFFKAYMEANPRFKQRERELLAKVVRRTRKRLIKRRRGDKTPEALSFRALLSGKQY